MVGTQEIDALIILLGGFFGLLPDTLDFKFMNYIETNDIVLDPDPYDVKPQEIADKFAEAINRAGTLSPGKMVKIQTHTLKLGPDLWQSYSIFFDTRKKEVVARVGPHVTMSGVPAPGTEPPPEKALGVARFNPALIDRYGKPSMVQGFSGPSFGFLKKKDGSVEVAFIPWHRRSAHSLTLGALFALIGALLCYWLNWSVSPWVCALAIFLPWSLHLLVDAYGHMGNNLFWPVTKQRTNGLYCVSAANPFWNFFAVWSCIALILWNMNYYAVSPMYQAFGPDVSIWLYLFLAIVIPMSIVGTGNAIYQARARRKPTEVVAPMGGAAAVTAAEGWTEMKGPEITQQPKPPLWVRILGLAILPLIFVLLFMFGSSL